MRVGRVGFSWMSCKNHDYSKHWFWKWVMAGLVICITHIGEEMLKTLLFSGMGVLVKWTDQPPQTAQIWNYLPPRAKNSSESAMSRLISDRVKQSSDFTVAQFASTSDRHVFNGHTYGPKEHDSMVELSCTNSTDFEGLGSTGKELV